MHQFFCTFCAFLLLGLNTCLAQHTIETNEIPGYSDNPRGANGVRVMFWNVENLFDTFDDSLTLDDNFTPTGNNHWTQKKYQQKLHNIAQTITAVGGWEATELICLSEVENKKVLVDLTQQTLLQSTRYEIIHKDSPDKRGIDLAFLYRPDKFKVESYAFIPVDFGPSSRPSRDILRITGVVKNSRVHIFINHWPSRYGGHMATEPKRIKAATIVRSHIDSILNVEKDANIVITGDFNDEPEDKSLKLTLGCITDTVNMTSHSLFNLMEPKSGFEGTHKYKGRWGILDQFIVSKGLIKQSNGLRISNNSAIIFKANFLLEKDKTHIGKKLNRTFIGPKYNGGYSDHLPIYLDLQPISK